MENLHEEGLICWTCKVKFRDITMFRDHYRTEWHRYNITTVANGLSPITLEDFEKKEAIYRVNDANQTKKKQICKVCRKKFNCQKQYENHLASKIHKKKLEQKDTSITISQKSSSLQYTFNKNEGDIETDSDIESLDSDEWELEYEELEYQIKFDSCLFCDYHNKSIERIMIHMEKKHSFFVPDLKYCDNLCGLLMCLQYKICNDFKCIWCNDSGRKMRSKEAVKMHMIDKGHCKMLYDAVAMHDYSSFYDYSTSYPNAENADPDEELSDLEILDDDGYVMKLLSGKSIVHRDMALYYKQNVPVPSDVTLKRKDFDYWLRKRLYKQISFGTMERRFEAARMTARDVRNTQQVQTKYLTQLQVKQNKLQKHYRRQTNF